MMKTKTKTKITMMTMMMPEWVQLHHMVSLIGNNYIFMTRTGFISIRFYGDISFDISAISRSSSYTTLWVSTAHKHKASKPHLPPCTHHNMPGPPWESHVCRLSNDAGSKIKVCPTIQLALMKPMAGPLLAVCKQPTYTSSEIFAAYIAGGLILWPLLHIFLLDQY